MFKGTEFVLQDEEKVPEVGCTTLNALNTSELETLNGVRWYILWSVMYHN